MRLFANLADKYSIQRRGRVAINLRQAFQGDLYLLLMERVLPDPLFVHDHDGRFLEVNAKACESVGYSRAELLTMNVLDLERDFDLAAAQEAWSRINAGTTEILYGHQRHKSGRIFPVELHFGLMETNGQRLYFGTARDISVRVSAETVLRDTAAQLRAVFEAMTEGVVLQVSGGRIIDANSAAAGILGLDREQLLGKTWADSGAHFIREDGAPYSASDQPGTMTLRTGQAMRDQLMGVHDASLRLRWFSVDSQPIFTAASAAPTAAITTFIDLTARQDRLTDDLRLARADLQAILDNAPARITSWLPDYTNRFANRIAAAHFGLASGNATGKYFKELLGDTLFAAAKPFMDRALAGVPQLQEVSETLPDGSRHFAHIRYVPMRDADRVVGIYLFATDVSDLRKSYDRIRELAQRLEAVREEERRSIAQLLHEGIAQDLFAMKLGLDNLEAQARGRAGVTAAFKEITTAIGKCMSDTRQIANALLPNALAQQRVAEAIDLHARYFAELSGLRITVDEIAPFPTLNESTRLTLFRAAQEALTNVARHAHASRVAIVLRAQAGSVEMEVTDDGIGIPEDALSNVGSLGLLGMRERIAALGGEFSISNNNGAGTTVSVRVPVPDGGADRAKMA